MGAYFWADAGVKSAGTASNLWLAGIWDDKGGAPDVSKNAEINSISTINTAAELGCPSGAVGTCLERVPLAYVPQNDGKGVVSTAVLDGSTTPNGNNWLSIKNRAFGIYNAVFGGMASTDNSNIGGYTGNHLKQVEISNIRVALANIETTLNNSDGSQFGTEFQGKVVPSNLQPSDSSLNLPTGSQGPAAAGIWDNVRNPNNPNADYTLPTLLSVVEFPNTGFNFTANPTTITSATGLAQDLTSLNGQATSLLQDGQGNGYKNQNEPLTLTGSVTSADTSLKWDEFANWSQVDDKGHYYTNRGHQATGDYWSGATNATYQRDSFNPGSQVCTASHIDTTQTPNVVVCDSQTVCSNVGYRNDSVGTQTFVYYSPDNTRTQFGWLNTAGVGSVGSASGTPGSTHFAPNTSQVPVWASLGVTDYWQTNAGGMAAFGLGAYGSGSTAGSSKAAGLNSDYASNHWIYDKSDPAYTNRFVYDVSHSDTHYISYSQVNATGCMYPNGSLVRNGASVITYYPGARGLLYENTSPPGNTSITNGEWNFQHDDAKDGTVDTSWAYVSNKQRVQYGKTYKGHSRKLGTRTLADPASAVDCTNALANQDKYFLGESGVKCLLPGRDSATIYNPTIGVTGAADVVGTAGIDGYFSGNNAPSAFLFSNGVITSAFNSAAKFSGYYLNSAKRANAFYDPTSAAAAIKAVFGNFFTTAASKAIGNNISGAFDLGQDTSRLYKPAVGDVTIGATTFTSGKGTIYVQGNLHITGNVQYANSASATDKTKLPSVGFVVTGNIIVDPNVTSIVGTYFAGGSFNTRSILNDYSGLSDTAGSPNNNRANSDTAFRLNGVMIALDFSLQRQPSGAALQAGVIPETFTYDGRVIVNPPQGFTDLQKYPAAWNESVPYN